MGKAATRTKTSHLPENADLVRAYLGAQGIARYEFRVASGSDQAPYEYHVNADGSRPFCSCRVRHPYAKTCRLESPEYAAEMAERAERLIAGLPVFSGF